MRHVRGWSMAVVVLALVAGCGPGGPDAATVAAGQARATKVLDAWTSAATASGGKQAVVMVGDLTEQIGDWEPSFGDNAKRALMAGMVASETTLAAPAPSAAPVTWPDGTSVSVPVLSVDAALTAIGASAAPGALCPDCTPLIATAATLATEPVTTTRGPATGPVWVFSIRGTAVKVTRVAIADPVTVPPMPDDPGGVLAIGSATSTVGAKSVTVEFVGAPDPGNQACGEDYTADAVESDEAVTVLVWRHPYAGLAGLFSGCTAVGAYRTATATLATPLGDRVVLDPASGQPVTLTLAP